MSVTSFDENKFLSELASENKDSWIGLNSKGKRTFRWTSGEELVFQSWQNGMTTSKPDPDSTPTPYPPPLCTFLSNGTWIQSACLFPKFYTCERPGKSTLFSEGFSYPHYA